MAHIDEFLRALFALAEDTDREVVKCVCSAFVLLVEVRVDVLMPHLASIVEVISYLIFLQFYSIYVCVRKTTMKPSLLKPVNFGCRYPIYLCVSKFSVRTLTD